MSFEDQPQATADLRASKSDEVVLFLKERSDEKNENEWMFSYSHRRSYVGGRKHEIRKRCLKNDQKALRGSLKMEKI